MMFLKTARLESMKKEKQNKKELENDEISRTRNSLMLELLAHAEAETQLRESEEKYRNLVSSLPEGIFSARDITEKVTATFEKSRLQKELEKSKKMEAFGILAGGVAHDLNNVLSGLSSIPDIILGCITK
jgi:C4-dicarboxylate-specific signal transduction histidine kinase